MYFEFSTIVHNFILDFFVSRDVKSISKKFVYFTKYKSLKVLGKKQLIEAVKRDDKRIDLVKIFDIPLNRLSTILRNKYEIIYTPPDKKCNS